MKRISIDDINMHLVETIEMLKNNSSDDASACEKIDVETAKTIADLSKVIIDGVFPTEIFFHTNPNFVNPIWAVFDEILNPPFN